MLSCKFSKNIFLFLGSLTLISFLLLMTSAFDFLSRPFLKLKLSSSKPILTTGRRLQFTGNFNGGNNYMNNDPNSFSGTGGLVYTGPISSGQNSNFGSQGSDDVFTGPFSSGLNEGGNFGGGDVFTGPVTSAQNQPSNNFGGSLDGLADILASNDFGQNNNFTSNSGKWNFKF
jgi:hypothetical protein